METEQYHCFQLIFCFPYWDCLKKLSEMMDNGEDEQIDVRSVVEAVSADHSFGAPLYVVESMCMRCHENVSLSLSLYLSCTRILTQFSLRFMILVMQSLCPCHRKRGVIYTLMKPLLTNVMSRNKTCQFLFSLFTLFPIVY